VCVLTPLRRECGKFRIEWENWFRVVYNYSISCSVCCVCFLQNDSVQARSNFMEIAERVKSCNSKVIFFFFLSSTNNTAYVVVQYRDVHVRRRAGDTYEIVYYVTDNLIVTFCYI
jgi:hypothetical protein